MADFTNRINAINDPLKRWLQTQIQSDFIPGLFDYQNMFKSLTSAPFTKQPGGGVGSLRARNDQTMSQMLPGEAPLVAGAADQKNMFSDMLNQATGLSWALRAMQDEIKAARTRLDTSNSGGLFGLLGI